MKAVQLLKYNKRYPKMKLEDIDLPDLGLNDVLVEITAAGVNPVDNMIARGDLKFLLPYKLPQTMGNEFVGVIKKLGANVTEFSVGDRVFARMPVKKIGSFAQQAVINKHALAKVPDYLTDEEAAAVPLDALTAVQALNKLHGKPGDTLFISAGTGGFGQMAIPLAVHRGYKVIVSGNSAHEEEVKKLGATTFIDYKTEKVDEVVSQVDYIIDGLGGKALKNEMRLLKPGGTIVSLRGIPDKKYAERVGLAHGQTFVFSILGARIDHLAKQKHQHYYFLFVNSCGSELAEASKVLTELQIHPAVGDIYSLDEYGEALYRVAQGHNNGKVIIKM
ncbi:NADP-dependent oxidoreductase [Lactobacillus sp. PSON]|uniref:NADP-dependent oxidoreductase n=1 Tax=Lactobacillus sp. PSON TaxID=3455454 RepID=UPI0040412E79